MVLYTADSKSVHREQRTSHGSTYTECSTGSHLFDPHETAYIRTSGQLFVVVAEAIGYTGR